MEKFGNDVPIDVSIVLPTYRRPSGLKAAMESLYPQTALGKRIEILVADNDPLASARDFVEAARESSGLDIRYMHVPQPGVANVRNQALTAARGRYIAFLDDDQTAATNWLSVLIAKAEKFKASAVFTAIRPSSGISPKHKTELLKFFARTHPHRGSTVIDGFFGCGSSLVDLSRHTLPDPPFCPTTNETGGEDDRFFSALKDQGAIMVWTDETYATEHVDDSRMSARYIRTRSFAYGQGPSRLCAPPNPLNILGLIKWTVIGTGQFGVYGSLFLLTRAAGSPKSVWFMRKACEGAGKVLWYERFRPRIYGAPLKAKQFWARKKPQIP